MAIKRPVTKVPLLSALLAVLLLVGVAAPIGAQSSSSTSSAGSVEFERYGGADRYATSLEIADAVLADAGSAEWAVMVSGESWPDAVVASSLAGALGAPVLLTPPGRLRSDTEAYLQRAGTVKVMVVGSTDSPGVSGAVQSALAAKGYVVERVSGNSRSGTSVAVARRLGELLRSGSSTSASVGSMRGFGETAILASSETFADALVAGPASAHGAHPVLLTSPGSLDADISTYLAEAAVKHVVLMGGTAALGALVEQSLDALGLEVSRLAGATRFETAVLMSELIHGRYVAAGDRSCFAHSDVGLARARVPFDSFGAGPLLARRCAPLLLTDPRKPNAATSERLDEIAASAAASGPDRLRVHVFGGTAAVSDAVLTRYFGGEESAEDPNAQPASSTSGFCGAAGGTRRDLANHQLMYYARWSPDCSRMSYVVPFGALWVANGDGSGATELVPESRRVSWHAWSPDGSRLAFSAATGNGDDRVRHIYVMNADGTRERRLTGGTVSDDEPSWSPDGRRLVFRRRDGSGMPHSAKARNQDVHLVTIDVGGDNERALLVGGAHEELPAWSPDGSRIAFLSEVRLWTVDAEGGDPVIVAKKFPSRSASWSPDGERLAFSEILNGTGDGRSASVVVIDLDGLTEHRIPFDASLVPTGNFFPNAAPQWSSDGRRVFFHLASRDPWSGRGQPENWMHVLEVPGIDKLEPHERTCRIKAVSYAHTVGFPLPDFARSATGTLRVAVLFVDFPDAVATHSTREESSSSLAYFERYLETSSGGRLDVELVPHHVWLRADHEVDYFANARFHGGLLDEDISEHAVQLADDDFDFSDIDIALTVMPSTRFGGGGNEGFDVSADGNVLRVVRINHSYGAGGSEDRLGLNPWGRTAVRTVLHSLGLKGPNFYGSRSELLAWSKWQLGWLDASQVTCVKADSATVRLTPAGSQAHGAAMAAVQLSANAVIVAESQSLADGVLVYTVNSLLVDQPIDFYSLLDRGGSVSVDGYTISVVGDTGTGYVVSIRKNN